MRQCASASACSSDDRERGRSWQLHACPLLSVASGHSPCFWSASWLYACSGHASPPGSLWSRAPPTECTNAGSCRPPQKGPRHQAVQAAAAAIVAKVVILHAHDGQMVGLRRHPGPKRPSHAEADVYAEVGQPPAARSTAAVLHFASTSRTRVRAGLDTLHPVDHIRHRAAIVVVLAHRAREAGHAHDAQHGRRAARG
eukprot:5379309-Prymnesium_polylepis.1